jgi:hypothetical protein
MINYLAQLVAINEIKYKILNSIMSTTFVAYGMF